MRLLPALTSAALAYLSMSVAAAQESCPAGPFETNVHVIAAAIAAHPLHPKLWDASRDDHAARIEDGVSWSSTGGLMNYGSTVLSYDAERYVVVHVRGEWPPRGTHLNADFGRELSNQVVRRQGNSLYTTTITRPTPEQARHFACLTNQLAATPQGAAAPKDAGTTQGCSTRGSETFEGSDAYFGGFGLVSRGTVVEYNTTLSCADRSNLLNRMETVVQDMVDEAIARAEGTWRSPFLQDIAADDANDLYLFVNPGSLPHYWVDLIEERADGNVSRTELAAFRSQVLRVAVDPNGHVYEGLSTPASKDTGPESGFIQKLAFSDDTVKVPSARKWPPPGLFPVESIIDGMAVDGSGRIYTLHGSNIVRYSPTGERESFASLPMRRQSWWSRAQPLQIAAASDGTAFVSDTSANVIYRIGAERTVTLLAGTPGKSGHLDGRGSSAQFDSPRGLAVDRNGNLYVADSGNDTIRRITPDGQVSTVAGKAGESGNTDGKADAARFTNPARVAVNGSGTLFVISGHDATIRTITPDGRVTTSDAQPLIDTD